MFGFLRAAPHDRIYRQIYAGCCGFQHARFGIATLPLLSYESIFLYVLAMDAGLCSRPNRADVTCCRFRRSGKRLHEVDAKFAEFCSAFGLLLASIKLEDDVWDDRSLLARLALWQLRSRIERAFEYFSNLDASFRGRIARHIQRQLDLENNAQQMTIDEYAKPTAAASLETEKTSVSVDLLLYRLNCHVPRTFARSRQVNPMVRSSTARVDVKQGCVDVKHRQWCPNCESPVNPDWHTECIWNAFATFLTGRHRGLMRCRFVALAVARKAARPRTSCFGRRLFSGVYSSIRHNQLLDSQR